MPYKPPLHIIQKDKPAPVDKLHKAPSRTAKIFDFTLSYSIKGMALGIALSWFYCYAFLGHFSAKYLIAGPIVGWIVGWLVGRFFYRD